MARLSLALVAVCAAVVVWVHVLPLQLRGVEQAAAGVAKFQQRLRLAQEAAGQRLTQRDLDLRVEQWARSHPDELAAQQAKLAQSYREALRYSAANGRTYTYLGDEDSYAWVRLARNYLEHGTTCDAIRDGECRDELVNGRLGARLIYNRSLHIAAIVALHRLLTVFDPKYPLTATSFWIPVLVAALGVWPAYGMGRRLAGPVAGVGAALLTALHPIVLQRSIGSDNDIWNVVLPLYANFAAMAALLATRPGAQIVWIIVAALVTVLHALTWSGWIFNYAVLTATLLGSAAIQAVAALLRRAPRDPAKQQRAKSAPAAPPSRAQPLDAAWQALRTPLLLFAVFYVVVGIGAAIVRPTDTYFGLPFELLGRAAKGTISGDVARMSDDNVESGVWPYVLRTVSELKRSSLAELQERSFGQPYFIGGLLGLLLAILPRRLRGSRAVALAAVLAASLLVLGSSMRWGSDRATMLAVLPLLAALLWRARSDDRQEKREIGALLLAVLWFFAGLDAAVGGNRFGLLFAPGLGLAIALGAGRLHQLLSAILRRAMPQQRAWISGAVVGVLVCASYIPAAQRGYTMARNYVPSINDTWWDSLTALRQRAAPDAIVDAWWDYGYWVKYIAERRTIADGSMLLTHLPYWLGRALVSASEQESIGVLRMLSCGSDAGPLPEGKLGAYEMLRAKFHDAVRAQAAVIEMVKRQRPEAAAYLAEQGFTAEEQSELLARTHCQPPETYLLIGTDLTHKDSWMRMAAWDFRRAYIAAQAKDHPEATVVADARQRFGYSEGEAADLYRQARHTPEEEFIIGPAPRAPSVWYPCQTTPSPGVMRCPLGLMDLNTHNIVDDVVFNSFAPENTVVHYRPAPPGHPPGSPIAQAPAALIVTEGTLRDVPLPEPRFAEMAVLADTKNWRVLVGPAPLIRSTFTHLLFLDGRYAKFFEKIDERTAYNQERLQTWRLNFPQQ